MIKIFILHYLYINSGTWANQKVSTIKMFYFCAPYPLCVRFCSFFPLPTRPLLHIGTYEMLPEISPSTHPPNIKMVLITKHSSKLKTREID